MGQKYLLRLLLCFLLVFSPGAVWAFPVNSVLATFTGSDNTSPPDSSWTNAEIKNAGGGGGGCDIEDNAVTASTTGGAWGCYWNVQTFGPDAEAFATINNIGSTIQAAVCVRIVNPGDNSADGYCVEWADSTGEVIAYRLDNGAATQLALYSQAVTTTDKVGISATGDQICAWWSDNGGAWTQLGCSTDATYTAAGYIAVYINGNTGVGAMDDFGGGTIGTTSQMKRRLTQG